MLSPGLIMDELLTGMKAGDSALLQVDDEHISPRTWLCDTPIIDRNFHRIFRDILI